ncbi:MAG: ABC transporter permease [Candidatus Binatia bacterium]|nr:ABC transporter permease [Candidatus Binatia bacterium]
MRPLDFLRMITGSIRSHPLRSGLTALGIAVGIAAVVLLTSIGVGINVFIIGQFNQFGTNILGINPGKTTTNGGPPMFASASTKPLTVEDALVLKTLPRVQGSVPFHMGNAEVEAGRRRRRSMVLGVGTELPEVFGINPVIGRFLPPDDPHAPRALAVLGRKVHDDLFPNGGALGERVRISGEKYRIIGVLGSKGDTIGFDLDDAIYIPASRSLAMFNEQGLMEIDLTYSDGTDVDALVAAVKRRLTGRHGQEDYTVTTQEQMIEVMGRILGAMTFAVAALGGISLLVGAVGIFTIMTIAVRERTSEIGLLRALGARHRQVLALFLGEAAVLAGIGGAAGLALGIGGGQLLHLMIPMLPVHTPFFVVVIAMFVSTTIGLLAGVLPARRAARLDPVEALRTE